MLHSLSFLQTFPATFYNLGIAYQKTPSLSLGSLCGYVEVGTTTAVQLARTNLIKPQSEKLQKFSVNAVFGWLIISNDLKAYVGCTCHDIHGTMRN